MLRRQTCRGVLADLVSLMAAGMIDKPCGRGLNTRRSIRHGRIKTRSILRQCGSLLCREYRIHKERAAAVAIVIRSGQTIAASRDTGLIVQSGKPIQISQNIGLSLGGGHIGQCITGGIFEHALGGTNRKYGLTNIGGGHAIAHLDAERLGQLPIADRAFSRMGKGKGNG